MSQIDLSSVTWVPSDSDDERSHIRDDDDFEYVPQCALTLHFCKPKSGDISTFVLPDHFPYSAQHVVYNANISFYMLIQCSGTDNVLHTGLRNVRARYPCPDDVQDGDVTIRLDTEYDDESTDVCQRYVTFEGDTMDMCFDAMRKFKQCVWEQIVSNMWVYPIFAEDIGLIVLKINNLQLKSRLSIKYDTFSDVDEYGHKYICFPVGFPDDAVQEDVMGIIKYKKASARVVEEASSSEDASSDVVAQPVPWPVQVKGQKPVNKPGKKKEAKAMDYLTPKQERAVAAAKTKAA